MKKKQNVILVNKKQNVILIILALLMGFVVVASGQTDSTTSRKPAQCIATTSKGVQCKRRFKTPEFTDQHKMKCWQHDSHGLICGSTTASKKKCRRRVKKEGDRCYHHAK